MADWVHDEEAKTWHYGDDLKVVHGKGVGSKDIYHCYKDGKYIAQETSIEAAKASCKRGGPKKG